MSKKNQSISLKTIGPNIVQFIATIFSILVFIVIGALLVGGGEKDTETRVVYSVSGAKYSIGDVVYTIVDNKAVTGEIINVESDHESGLKYIVLSKNPNYIEECGEAQELADSEQSYENVSWQTMKKCGMGDRRSDGISFTDEEYYNEFKESQLKKTQGELCNVLFE